MSGRHVEHGRGRGESFVLALAFALLFPILAFAVAPPPAPEEVPGPGPLLNPDDIHTNPVHMAMAVVGSTIIRDNSSPWVTAATLYGGVQAGSWDLKGIMSFPETRRPYGAALLVAAGFGPGGSQLGQLALLPTGQSFDFWALQNTDKLLYLPPEDLRVVQDGFRTGNGGGESVVYNQFLKRAFFTSPKAFASGVKTDLTYTHLLGDPERYRGEVVRIDGRLLRINKFPPPHEVQEEGVSALYEAYIFNESFGSSPYCVVFTNWPEHLPLSYLGQAKIKDTVRVRTDGYFVKTYKYKASDGRNTERELPLVVTHTLQFEKPPEVVTDRREWVYLWMYGFMAALGALVVGVLGVTYWYRRNDLSTRRRLMAHAPEFVLPTPDAPPFSPPMAMPVRPTSGIDRSVPMRPRITFPSSGKGDGERGEKPKEGQPPDEGAGA